MDPADSLSVTFPSRWAMSGRQARREFTGAVFADGTLIFYFRDGQQLAAVSQIKSIRFEGHLFRKQDNQYTLDVMQNGERTRLSFPEIFFIENTMQKFVQHLLSANPDIQADIVCQDMLEMDVEYTEKLKFDFKVHQKHVRKIIVNKHIATVTVVYVFLLISLIAGVPIVGGYILESMHGEHFGEYRIGLLLGAAFMAAMTLVNLLLALQSKYKGHIVTLICLLLAIAGAVMAFA